MSELIERMLDRGSAYTCNGSKQGCERTRFGGCIYCEQQDRLKLQPCPNCTDGRMVPSAGGDNWCDTCESSLGPGPTCPMCGVEFAQHDGLTAMCRRYHRLRVEVGEIVKEHKEKMRGFIMNGNLAIMTIVGQLEWALDAAANNTSNERTAAK